MVSTITSLSILLWALHFSMIKSGWTVSVGNSWGAKFLLQAILMATDLPSQLLMLGVWVCHPLKKHSNPQVGAAGRGDRQRKSSETERHLTSQPNYHASLVLQFQWDQLDPLRENHDQKFFLCVPGRNSCRLGDISHILLSFLKISTRRKQDASIFKRRLKARLFQWLL